jgi:hypothetical protein
MIIPRALLSRLVLTALALCASSALAQSSDAEDPPGSGDVLGNSDVSQVGMIGRLHDRIRHAQQRESLYEEITGLYTDYTKWKTGVEKETNISYSMDVTLLDQWGSSDGGSPSLQFYATPGFDWTAFKSSSWGTGSIQFAYNEATFNNYLFAQNGSQTYLLTGLGGYVQFNVTSTIQLVAGFQGTNDPLGKSLTTKNFDEDCCASFGYVQWTPHIPGLGSAQYSFSYFDTPNNPSQPATSGWSVWR